MPICLKDQAEDFKVPGRQNQSLNQLWYINLSMVRRLLIPAAAKAFIGVLPIRQAISGLPSLRGQEPHTHLITSPRRTRRLFRTTLFIRIFSSEHVSSESTMHTASRLFFPFSNTVSPRNNCSSSILGWGNKVKAFGSLGQGVSSSPGGWDSQ